MQTPERILATMNAYQQSAALKAGIRLDLFTAVDEGARTISTLAERCGASERGVKSLADFFVVIGFLKKEGVAYSLADEAKAFLSRKSPMYLGSASLFLNSERMMACFDDLDDAVRRGGTLLPGEGSVNPENPMWVDFARGMAPMMRPAAMGIAKTLGGDKEAPLKVLDIAAGHGVFGIAVAKEFPKATVTALDWKSVLEVAIENATEAGVRDRYRLLPGDAFEVPYGEQYDVILITNFLHHFDIPTCESFLKKVHGALRPGGRAATLEFVPNEDRVSPPIEAAFSLVMLASTQGGDAYTFAEYEKMFTKVGFTKNEILPVLASPEHLILSTK